MTVILLGLLAVLIGAVLQRLTGMGFALVAAPFMVLLFGPVPGVMLVNLCGAISSALVLSRIWRDTDWRQAGKLMLFAVFGIVAGAWVGSILDPGLMAVFIGGLIIAAMTSTLLTKRIEREIPRSIGLTATSGVTGGFMNAAAGVGGPALAVYAVLTRWEQRTFAATLQPVLFMMGMSSLGFKLLFEPEAWPQLHPLQWLGIGLCIVIGQVIGEQLSKRVPIVIARRIMITLAYGGGIAALIDGIVRLAS